MGTANWLSLVDIVGSVLNRAIPAEPIKGT
jgi:hypothetical protein